MPPDLAVCEQLAAFVGRVVGGAVAHVERLPGSVANLDNLVRLADGSSLVVRVGPRAEMVAEAWACRRLPVADLARLSMSGPAITAAFLAGYGLAPDRAITDQLTRYRILWNLRALHYEHQAGGDWFDAYRTVFALTSHSSAADQGRAPTRRRPEQHSDIPRTILQGLNLSGVHRALSA